MYIGIYIYILRDTCKYNNHGRRRTATNLTPHRIRINLTHVRARVVRLDVGHVQFPRVMSIVSDRQPWVLSDHVRMNGQDSFGVGLHPGDLHNIITGP